MDKNTLVKCESEIPAGDRCENAYWLVTAANALAHELAYANKGQIGRYDDWQVASMIEAAADAAMAEIAIVNEYLCDEAQEKKTRED